MQIFVNCLGDTKCFDVQQGENIELLKSRVQQEFGFEQNINLYSFSGVIENDQSLEELNNQTLEALIEVVGGKGGKKKKKITLLQKKTNIDT